MEPNLLHIKVSIRHRANHTTLAYDLEHLSRDFYWHTKRQFLWGEGFPHWGRASWGAWGRGVGALPSYRIRDSLGPCPAYAVPLCYANEWWSSYVTASGVALSLYGDALPMIDGLVETGKVAAISYWYYQKLLVSIARWHNATDLHLSLREVGVGLRWINRAG
jgi:hypothetical protein